MITSKDFKPHGRRVLLETVEEELLKGPEGFLTLIAPVEFSSRYPPTGWVVQIGDGVTEDLKPDDFVVLEDEGREVDRTYYDIFHIKLRDNDGTVFDIKVDNDVEPVFREQMDAYWANPSDDDRVIAVQDVETGEGYRFNASDVLDFGYVDLAHPTYRLEYIPTHIINLWDEEDKKFRMHYLVDERKILAVIRN